MSHTLDKTTVKRILHLHQVQGSGVERRKYESKRLNKNIKKIKTK